MLLRVKAKMDIYGHDPYIKHRATMVTRIALFSLHEVEGKRRYICDAQVLGCAFITCLILIQFSDRITGEKTDAQRNS